MQTAVLIVAGVSRVRSGYCCTLDRASSPATAVRTRRSRLEANEPRTCGRKTRRNQVLAPQSKAKKLELKEPWTRLGALPIATYEAGETVLSAGSSTGQLLILKTGKVSIVKENVEIAKVAAPGAVFGELSALLNQPHAADVCALEASQFHIAEAAALIGDDPAALLYIASVLARRLDSANQALIELKRQVQPGQSRSEIGQTIKKMEMALTPATASLVYAGYPYDPYA